MCTHRTRFHFEDATADSATLRALKKYLVDLEIYIYIVHVRFLFPLSELP